MAESASQLIASLLGDAFLAAAERHRRKPFRRARAVWTWLQDVAAAPPGLELIAPDGAVYTGLVLVERSRAVLLIGLRHRSRDPSLPQPPATPDEGLSPGLFDETGWWDTDPPPDP